MHGQNQKGPAKRAYKIAQDGRVNQRFSPYYCYPCLYLSWIETVYVIRAGVIACYELVTS
jgi:hypothetical protein